MSSQGTARFGGALCWGPAESARSGRPRWGKAGRGPPFSSPRRRGTHVERVILKGASDEHEDGKLQQRHDGRQGHHQAKELPEVLRGETGERDEGLPASLRDPPSKSRPGLPGCAFVRPLLPPAPVPGLPSPAHTHTARRCSLHLRPDYQTAEHREGTVLGPGTRAGTRTQAVPRGRGSGRGVSVTRKRHTQKQVTICQAMGTPSEETGLV